MSEKPAEITQISKEYFAFMAQSYPTMCLCDEFHFFPRAQQAIKHLNYLDSLDKEKIKQDISYIKTLGSCLNKKNLDLENAIDQVLLKQNIQSVLWELERVRTWQRDPNLYLKIIVLGIEQILCKLSIPKQAKQELLFLRISQIPRLLNEAKTNLNKIPMFYQEAADKMIKVASVYLSNIQTKHLKAPRRDAIRSLDDFNKFLKNKSYKDNFIKDSKVIKDLLRSNFSYSRSLERIFQIASRDYRITMAEIKETGRDINTRCSWNKIISNYRLKLKNSNELLRLYSERIWELKNLTKQFGIRLPQNLQNIKVLPTPFYLLPIRASASYSCPVTTSPKESGFFYISIGSGGRKSIQDSIHQEYIFVSAHETFPGHHLLDSIRRKIKNPIRQQIESALFYEGWASYAESLIMDSGYLADPRQKLIGLRRRAWRAIRAKIDVGIRINKFTLAQAAKELLQLGYSKPTVKKMIKHYTLTYGYQLCYTIGKFEIEKLKKKFAPRIGIKRFHECLLYGGQLPFDLISKRLERLCQKNS